MAGKLWTFLLLFGSSWVWPASAHRKLLVLLLDGFRSDYISEDALASLPGFREIVNRGVKVDYLTPDFPSLSYPNYYTLMTGEYPPRRLLEGRTRPASVIGNLSVPMSLVPWDIRDRQEPVFPTNTSISSWFCLSTNVLPGTYFRLWTGLHVSLLNLSVSLLRSGFLQADLSMCKAVTVTLRVPPQGTLLPDNLEGTL